MIGPIDECTQEVELLLYLLGYRRGVSAADKTVEFSLAEQHPVSEAVTNAIAAHAAHRIEDRIRVRCVPSPGRVEIQVHDRGGGFDASRVPEPPEPTDPRRLHAEKGMGLWLMRIMSDDHAISTSRRGTEVRLVVHTSSS